MSKATLESYLPNQNNKRVYVIYFLINSRIFVFRNNEFLQCWRIEYLSGLFLKRIRLNFKCLLG